MITAKATSFRTDNEDIRSCGQLLPFRIDSQLKGFSNQEIHRLAFDKVAMKYLEKIFRYHDVFIPKEFRMIQAMVFLMVLYRNESWILKKLN